jgi:hypothetical protein
MWGFLTRIGSGVQSLVGLVLPLFGKAKQLPGRHSPLRWVLHIAVVAALLVGLWYANQYFRLPGLIPSRFRILRESWLPILFLLVYTLCWLGWWLWQLLAPEAAIQRFPDLEAAWAEALEAMRRDGIDITEAPLFLVLGEPEAKHAPLFRACQVKFTVNPAPESPDAPLHVYANRDAIYVICPTASLLARQAAILTGDSVTMLAPPSAAPAAADEPNPSEDPLGGTLRPEEAGGLVRQMQAVLTQAGKEGRSPRQLTDEERRKLGQLERRDRPRPSLLRNVEVLEHLTARLEHLCQLIVRDRWPFCPVNGLLVLVPYAALESDQVALTTGDIIHRELIIVRHALKVHCPLFTLVCDLETVPGFTEFIGRFSETERQQRVGQRCPLVPLLQRRETAMPAREREDQNLEGMFHSLAHWLCGTFFSGWVYKKFRLETPNKAPLATVVKSNGRLFLFLEDLHERQERLAILLAHALVEESGPPLFGGCYFAGTGKNPATEQAFVAGVFRRLPEEQNWVAWTPEALAEEEGYQRWVRRGWGLLIVISVAAVGVLGYFYFLGGGR